MSEQLSTGDWAEPEAMAFWRDQISQRQAARAAEGVTKFQAFEFKEPEKAAEALHLLAQGAMTQKAICTKLGIYGTTLSKLARYHAGSLAEAFEHTRKDLAARYLNLAARTAGLMEKKIDNLEDDEEALAAVPIKDLAITIGIIHDKGMAAAGAATTVIEHRTSSSMEEYEALRNAARERLQKQSITVEAHVLEVAEA